jgi:predicted O-methyltransferase YrrM
VDVIYRSRAQMLPRERLYLYTTVLALAPERCLEIGVAEGGSSRIIHAALCDLGKGRLVALDPQPRVLPEEVRLMADRVTFLSLPSPQGLQKAREVAGGLFDFVLVDGDHSTEGVLDDLEGLIEVTRPGTLILAHDAYYPLVERGIRAALQERLPFVDAGMVSTTPHPGVQNGEPVTFAGFRLLVRTADAAPQRSWMRRVARRLKRLVR